MIGRAGIDWRHFQVILERWGVLVAFALLLGISTYKQGFDFLNPENVRALLNSNAPVGILAVGMTLVIACGGIDLSVGSIVVLAAALGTTAMNRCIESGASELNAVLLGGAVTIGSGILAGCVNGALVVFGRIAPFIATLGGLAAFRSMSLAIADAGEIRSQSAALFSALGRGGIPIPGLENAGGKPLTLSYSTVIFFVVAAIAQWFLSRARFGRHLIAVGANETAARYSGVSVAWIRFRVYAVMGLLAGVAALVQSSRMNSVSTSQLGLGSELDAIAAVVIGGTSLRGGFGRVWGTVVGVLILGMITNVLTISGVSPYWQGAIKGAVIVLAVLVQRPARA
ncbi:MAG: ABC transporter permease [Phycisphaerales bacterium]|nr:ABC transporter permease [Phycisphaerales bacterium]